MPTKKKTPRRQRPARIELQVDRALETRWQAELRVLERSRRKGASAFDALWEAVAAIIEHDPPLYLAAGLPSKKSFLEAHLGETERNAARMMRIAKYASPRDEERYGTAKLDAILSYLEAKTGGALKGRLPVALRAIKLTVPRNGKPTRAGLDALTVAEIAAETRKLRRSDAPKGKPSPIVAAVGKQLRGKVLGKITVRVVGGCLHLGAIPLDALAELGAVLRRIELPARSA